MSSWIAPASFALAAGYVLGSGVITKATAAVRRQAQRPTWAETTRVCRWYWEDRHLYDTHPQGPAIVHARQESLTVREKRVYGLAHVRARDVEVRAAMWAAVDQRLAERTGGDMRFVRGHLLRGVNHDCDEPNCAVHGVSSPLLAPAVHEPKRDSLPD